MRARAASRFAALAALALLAASSCNRRPDPLPGFPRVMLWAWERPERLQFVDSRLAGVAFLARSISWRDGQVMSRPRYQPLVVNPDAVLMAVARLESNGGPMPDPESLIPDLLKATREPRVRALEIDFD